MSFFPGDPWFSHFANDLWTILFRVVLLERFLLIPFLDNPSFVEVGEVGQFKLLSEGDQVDAGYA